MPDPSAVDQPVVTVIPTIMDGTPLVSQTA